MRKYAYLTQNFYLKSENFVLGNTGYLWSIKETIIERHEK